MLGFVVILLPHQCGRACNAGPLTALRQYGSMAVAGLVHQSGNWQVAIAH
jgi:hypothetical protein